MRPRPILSGVVALALILPGVAFAQSATDLMAQIAALMQQINALQTHMGTTPSAGTPASTAPSAALSGHVTAGVACPVFTRSLMRGLRGDDVLALQQFLASDGLLASDAQTGYFGALTEAAVKEWQTTYKVVSGGTPATTGWGVVGPRTAHVIDLNCAAHTETVTAGAPTQTGAAQCPAAPRPSTICAGSWHAVPGEGGCTAYWQCVVPISGATATTTAVPAPISCPVNPHPSTACSGSWHAAIDAQGCTTSWQCI